MTRKSIAERTLEAQIYNFQRQWNDLHAAQIKLATEMEVLETVISDLRLESERLAAKRQERTRP